MTEPAIPDQQQTQIKAILNSKYNRVLLIIVLLFVLARFFTFSNYKAVWIDEQISINAACGDSTLNFYSDEDLKRIMAENIERGTLMKNIFWSNLHCDRSNAILFDYTLSAWIRFFGHSTMVYRSMSCFFFILVIMLTLYLASRSGKFSIFLVLLLLFNSLLFRYNFQCRTYMFTTFLSMLSTTLLFSYLKSRRTLTLLFYFLLAGLSLFSHYLVMVVLIWHFVLLIYHSGSKERIKIISGYVLFSLLILSAIFFINTQTGFIDKILGTNKSYNLGADTSVHFKKATFSNLVTGMVQVLTQVTGTSLQSFLQIRFFAILLIVPALLLFKQQTFLMRFNRFNFLTLITVHLVFLVLVSTLSRNTTIFQLNYSIFVLPYYLIYIADLADTRDNTNPQLIRLIQILIITISLVDTIGYIFAA